MINRSAQSLFLLCLGLVALPAVAQLPNDTCATPIALAAGTNGPFSNVGANTTISACVGSNSDVFFSYTTTCPGSMTVTTCGGSIDTVLSAYASCGGASIACNDDTCGLLSNITFAAAAATTYYFRVASFGTGATGSFPMTVTPPPPCSSLIGSGLATPATVVQGNFTLLTVAMTSTAPPTPPTGCVGHDRPELDRWKPDADDV